MGMSAGKDDGEPMMEMNTTPLIDVMLVLLIMFIITIPVATHAVNIDLPQPSAVPNNVTIDPIKNKLVLTASNQILWNGAAINNSQLVSIIQATKGIDPEPELQFAPEEYASYEIANQMMKIITDAKVTKFGFVGNENFATFQKAGQ
ncbi:biopolymer transporter ExbD [Novosphingobium sp. SL115]|uniref:ExbD/TolR family protein n=1 Tax=Novosphingobium sp. SL115 TaxID=2995150 RepID=UPI0022742842|nr:biopolymer transporter ExbD [Novosphingobium sp. SL115]MCY1670217.1 biopolymer transporter ExbD [Novosphingobium sp. SL115]